MDPRLLRPSWLVAHTVVLVIAALFVSLGFWQLRRHDDKVSQNEVGERRLSSPAEDLGLLLASNDPEALDYRRAAATGEFDRERQLLVRSQVYRGTAGFHVITPLVMDDGSAVLVNRGWVPLGLEERPGDLIPPDGETTIEGWLQQSQERPPLGPEHPPEGVLGVFNRVDITRIAQQMPMELAPVYMVQIGGQGEDLPVQVRLPTFDDQGPHLAYAIQWFGFALVGVVGYGFLARRRLSLGSKTS